MIGIKQETSRVPTIVGWRNNCFNLLFTAFCVRFQPVRLLQCTITFVFVFHSCLPLQKMICYVHPL